MSPAEKYGQQPALPAAAMQQVQEAGQVMKDHGVTHDKGASETPAVKYGAPSNNHQARALSQGRSL